MMIVLTRRNEEAHIKELSRISRYLWSRRAVSPVWRRQSNGTVVNDN
jgi:hypothetical protein